MTATVQHWKNPTKISVTELVGPGRNYRLLADFAMPEVTDAEALVNAQLFAEAYNEHPKADALRMALGELVKQVEMSGAVDDHGHHLIMLQALEDARAALVGQTGEVSAE